MPNATKPLKVLVVDDEKTIADSLAAILRLSGYEAERVYSAEAALPWCSDNLPNVVLTDVVMGSMDGVQLAIHLSHYMPDCKVLLMSGHALAPSLVGIGATQGYSFPILAKPVHPREILAFLAAF